MAIDWSPLIAQNAVRNDRAQQGAYQLGDKAGNWMSNLPSGLFSKIKENMTDQEGLFQGGFDSGEERNRLFGRTRDAIEGIGQIGGNTLKAGLGLPFQFIKGVKNSGDNQLPDASGNIAYDPVYEKGLMDYLKSLENQDINNSSNTNNFNPNVQPTGQMDDSKSLLDFSKDYKGDTESTGYKMSHGQQYGVTDYGEYPEYGGIQNSDFNKDYSGETDYVDYGDNYGGDTPEQLNLNAGTGISTGKGDYKPEIPLTDAMLHSDFLNNKKNDAILNDKSSQEGMQMNMQYLQQQYPNLQLGSMQPGQSYTINLGDGQGMQSFQWNTGPMFGGQ
jgi:hypothetical protein|tara:strand:+ start:320 stop:1312 length:993 start_codon:yes stop_codon:yes gene_type:complete